MKRLLALLAVLLLPAIPASAADPDYTSQQWALSRMHVQTAWGVSTGVGVVVAIVDTGVDLGHPDLSGRLVAGRDFVDGDADPQDGNGHGTHMAGSVAAIAGNGFGINGVSPNARIMPVRVLDNSGRTDNPAVVADGIRWAVDNGAKVVNLSLAADGPGNPVGGQDLLATAPIDLAIRDAVSKGAIVVIAAGNSESGGESHTAYDSTVDGALVVGASTNGDKRAAYSNYGSGLDVVAPGGGSATDPSFRSGCTPGNAVVGLYWNPSTHKSEYAGACGTSVAVAQVSGVAALLIARGMSNTQAAQRIVDSAVDIGSPGRDDQTGAGRVDAARALRATSTRSTPGVHAAGSTPAKARPAQSASASPSPSQGPSVANTPEGSPPPQAASGSPVHSDDRSLPIAVAGALLFFTVWGFFAVLKRPT